MKKLHYGLHTFIYYIAWFAGILLAARGFAWLSAAIVMACAFLQLYWQYTIQQHIHGFWYLLGLLVFISTLVDSLLVFTGIVIFAANPFSPFLTPPWMMAMWVSFTVILYAILDKLVNHLLLLAILSFAGFALAFAAGAKMAAAYFPYGYRTCFFIGAIWLILLPTMVYYYQRLINIK